MARDFLWLATFACSAVALGAAACSADGDTSGASEAADTTAISSGDAESAVVAFTQRQMQAHDIPGAQIAIVENGKLAFQKALGVKKRGEPDPITNETRFRVASLSKMLVGAAALSLVDEGRLDLSAPVTRYLPSWKLAPGSDPSTVTLDDLTGHVSGLADLKISSLNCRTTPNLDAWFATDTRSPLWTPPGAVWNYSNRGYSVAGWAVESVAGVPFEEAIAERVLRPAGMTRATYDPVVTQGDDHAVGHYEKNGAPATAEPSDFDCVAAHPPAGLMATATDYAHFIEAIFADDGSILSHEAMRTFTTGRVATDDYPGERYAYGLKDYLFKGTLRAVHHNGDFGTGYLTSLWMVPEAKFGVVVFYNATSDQPDTVSRFALDQFFGLASTPYPVVTTSAASWAVYAGSYHDPFALGDIAVRFDGTSLLVDIPRKNVAGAALTQVAGDAFTFPFAGDPLAVTFFPSAAGAPAAWFVTRAGVGARAE
jgi:CubicO group peptidase (beta-lactamase class C family)